MTIGIEHFNWMCHTAAGTVIAPDLLIPLLTDADIERIVYDPPNRNISASHRRRFNQAMRRIIETRDQHCQHPCGCDEPAHRCDIDTDSRALPQFVRCLVAEMTLASGNQPMKRIAPRSPDASKGCPRRGRCGSAR